MRKLRETDSVEPQSLTQTRSFSEIGYSKAITHKVL